MPAVSHNQLWFGYDEAQDADIRQRFGEQVSAALAGELDHWADDSRGLVALIILLDQFTRNIYRGEPKAFSGDEAALAHVRAAIASEQDEGLPAIHRVFLYIPFEHCESLATQDEGITHFDRLLASSATEVRKDVEGFRNYAVAHRKVIAEYGRFPHRNRILGRENTPGEAYYLASNSGF